MSEQNPSVLRLVAAYHSEWGALVEIAILWRSQVPLDIPAMAVAAKKNPDAIIAKLSAISAALDDGVTKEQIIDRGERDILSSKAKKRAAAVDGLVAMNFKVAPDLKDRVLTGLEKIKNAMGYGTMENAWTWFDALITDLSDEEIRHLAGEGK